MTKYVESFKNNKLLKDKISVLLVTYGVEKILIEPEKKRIAWETV